MTPRPVRIVVASNIVSNADGKCEEMNLANERVDSDSLFTFNLSFMNTAGFTDGLK